MTELHSLLRRQLKQHFGEADAVRPAWQPFVAAVNQAYEQADDDREMLERSMELSSHELLQANAEMRVMLREQRDHRALLEQMVRERTARLTRVNEELRQEIDERSRAERELAAARDKALESVHLKSAFLANMSHEIRTPLNIILGYSSLIASEVAARSEKGMEEFFEGVERAGRRLQETIEGILDISKIETGAFELKPVDLDLAPLIERQIRDFRPLAEGKGLRLSWRFFAGSTTVRFDPYCLSRALTNLLQNAVKFTERGEIDVVLAGNGDGSLALSIRDTGIGIDPAFLPRLCEPFSQEEAGYTRRYEGSGLGLALAKKYIELNAATLSVESEKGRGSCFTIHLPGSGAGERHAKVAASAASTPATANGTPRPRVLVVEDDTQTQVFMQTLLRRSYDVDLAASGNEARRLLAENRVDIVLMDLSLKGDEDGLALTRSLRADTRWSKLPIIAVTAHAFEEDRARALAAGCSGFLTKPFGHRALQAMMTSQLRPKV